MKIKTTLLGFALLFAMQTMMAQYKISGSIQDEKTKEPLVGVSIYITDLKTGTLSNMEGYYQIDKIKPGRYLLDISAVGYKSMVKQITVRSDTSIHFILTPSVNELNEAIVTGVSRSTELKKSPVIVKTIDRTTMMQNSATNLIDALKNVPGMSQISTGASISKPVIRGLGYNRLITLNNGIRQEGQQWGDEHGIEMDEYAIDRVEIVKGPGSLMYGSDGIAGVLNFLAPKFPSKGDIKTQLISNYQSNNQLIGYSLSNTGNQKGIQWLGRMSTKWAANYQNDNDGKVLNSGFREMDVSLMGGVNKSWGHSHLSISSFQQQLNLPEGERDSLGRFTFVNAQGEEVTATSADYSGYKTGYPHQDIHHVRLSSNNYFILRKGTLQADFGFQNNKRKEFGNPADPNEIDLYFDLRTINYSIRYHAEEIKGWETSLGIGGMQQSHVNKGVDFLIPAYQLLDAGAFVYTQKSFRKCTIAGGVRLDLRSVRSEALYLDSLGQAVSEPDAYSELKFSPISRSYEGFSGSLGVSYAMNTSSTFKLNLSRGFRAPNIAELASNGRHEGTFRYELGNPHLKSEMSHQIDLAYFLNTEHITFECTPFVNFITQYIFVEKLKSVTGNDSIPDPSDPAPAFQYRSGTATLLGGELYFDIHPHPLDWLHIENSFSFVQATQKKQPDSSRYLPFIPAPRYRGEMKAVLKQAGNALSNAYIKFGIDYVFAQNNYYAAYGTETASSSYTLLSAGIGTSVRCFNRKDFLGIYIQGDNLANTAYQNHLSRLKYAPENIATGRKGIYNMGRNISVKMIVSL